MNQYSYFFNSSFSESKNSTTGEDSISSSDESSAYFEDDSISSNESLDAEQNNVRVIDCNNVYDVLRHFPCRTESSQSASSSEFISENDYHERICVYQSKQESKNQSSIVEASVKLTSAIDPIDVFGVIEGYNDDARCICHNKFTTSRPVNEEESRKKSKASNILSEELVLFLTELLDFDFMPLDLIHKIARLLRSNQLFYSTE